MADDHEPFGGLPLCGAACRNDAVHDGCASCLLVTFFPLCASASVVGRLPFGASVPSEYACFCCRCCSSGELQILGSGSCITSFALNFCPLLGQFLHYRSRCLARGWLRKQSGAEPAPCDDCAALFFCLACATCQDRMYALEVRGKNREMYKPPEKQTMSL